MTGTTKKCAICGKPVSEKFAPFCSARCATLDLGQWLGEGYRIPADEAPEESALLPGMSKDDEIG